MNPSTRAPLWPGLAALALATAYLIALLGAEKQAIIIGLLAGAIVAGVAAGWFGLLDPVSRSFSDREDSIGICAVNSSMGITSFMPPANRKISASST